MGKEYLTEAAVFVCPFGMRFKAQEMANHKAKYNGQKLLTSAAVLLPAQLPPIFCAKLQMICPCAVGPLGNGIEHRAKVNLLTMDAKADCMAAGESVTPQKAGTENRVIYKAAHPTNVEAIAWPMAGDTSKSPKSVTAKKQTSTKENKTSLQEGDSSRGGESVQTKAMNGEKDTKEQKKEKSFVLRAGMLCSCSINKSECMECLYRLDDKDANVDNDSIILRRSYNDSKPHTDNYDRYFDGEVEPLGNSKPNRWRYAAHHLISGNQVFKRNPELVRLARFCGYDINAYANCIMLVGYPEDYPDTERMKSVKAYDVMSEGRVQWHVGGHSYTFTDDEKDMICKQIGIRNKIKLTPADIKTYAELVQEEIDKLKQRLETKKNRQQVCYSGQQTKQQLCDKLDRISQRIKAKLAAFSDVGKPHHSFPFFVSKEAYRYTYGLPRTGKVIAVLKDGNRLRLTLYRLEHFTEAIADRERSLMIKSKDTTVLDLSSETWQMECILFCDNVSFFVYLDDTPRDVLPFTVDSVHQFPFEVLTTGKDGRRFLEEHDTEVLVWMRDYADNTYVSPALMIRKRCEELG